MLPESRAELGREVQAAGRLFGLRRLPESRQRGRAAAGRLLPRRHLSHIRARVALRRPRQPEGNRNAF